MKVLHSAALLNPPAGITYQMQSEQRAATELKLDWNVRIFTHKGALVDNPIVVESDYYHIRQGNSFVKVLQWWRLRREYHRWLSAQLKVYDFILIRYSVHDPFQKYFLKKSNKKVLLVHHTLEGPELRSVGLKGRVRAILDGLLAPGIIRSAKGVIGVTNEILEYEKERAKAGLLPGYVYPNGIFFTDFKVDDKLKCETPTILFVASEFSSWHGLDLLLESASKSSEKFTIHLIGDINKIDLDKVKNDCRFINHGQKSQDEIRRIANECWISLSSFALFRKNMKDACTLKVRESLMMGLPVYASYQEVFPKEFPYYRQGPCEISEILSFAHDSNRFTKSTVAQASRIYIDKKSLLAKAYGWLKSLA